MAAGRALVTLPDGQTAFGPVDPRTWSASDRARAKQLSLDVAGAVAFHRQRPFFQGLQTVSQSIPASAWTPVTLDWEMIDQWAGHSGTTSQWLTPVTQGAVLGLGLTDYYLCSGYVPLNASDTTKVGIAGLIKNGTDIREGTKIPYGASHAIDPMIIDLVGVQGGTDTIGLGAWTNNTGGAPTVVASKTPSLTCRWVGSAFANNPALPAVPHSWIPADQMTASATGASPAVGGSKVPLNSEIRDLIRYLNYPPLARLTSEGQSPTQTIPTGGAWTSIKLPTNNIDSYTGWSSGANTLYTVKRAGLYLVIGYATVAEVSAAGGYRAARLLVNGTTPFGGTSTVPMTSGATGTALYTVRHLRLNVNDTVELQMSQTGSSALPCIITAAGACRLILVWKGR